MNIPKLRSSEFKGAMIGMMMGDGCIPITKNYEGKNYFRLGHSIKQKDYLEYKVRLIENHMNGKKPIREWSQKLSNGKSYQCVCYDSPYSTYYTKLRERVYGEQGKKVTRDLLDDINELGLLLWYLDDGYMSIQYKTRNGIRRISDRKLRLSTHRYTLEENEVIKQWFKDRWDLDCIIYKPEPKKRPEQRSIYFNATNAKKFLSIILPYKPEGIHDKKFDMKYNGETVAS